MADGVTALDRDAVDGLLEQVQRMSTLVEQLLDLSRLESGAVHLDLEDVDLVDVARSVGADLSALAGQSDISLQVQAASPVVVRGDPVRLRQVVANLLSNAMTHTPAGGHIRVGVEHPRAPRLTVHDDGPGIPPADSERVFDRFHRVDRARGGDGGAGLGLAICRWIVDLHGGHIAHDPSAPGCLMVVDLPPPPPA